MITLIALTVTTLSCLAQSIYKHRVVDPHSQNIAIVYGDERREMSLNKAATEWLNKLETSKKTFLIQDGEFYVVGVHILSVL